MIRRPPRSTLFPYHDALPISPIGVNHTATGSDGDPPRRVGDDAFAAGGRDADRAREGLRRAATRDGDAVARSRRLVDRDRKSTRLNSSHLVISYAVFCLKQKN